MVFDQIQCYFTVNKLTTEFQHAHREGHSTSTALTQMTDDWLRENDCGAILLDFSAAFDIIDHSLLLEKRTVCVMAVHPLQYWGIPDSNWIIFERLPLKNTLCDLLDKTSNYLSTL